MAIDNLDFSRYQLGWSTTDPVFKPKKGINEAIVREMSGIKNEEKWMLDFRLSALKKFEKKPMVPWFAERMPTSTSTTLLLHQATENQVDRWRPPDDIKNTYERLGIPKPSASTWRRHRPVRVRSGLHRNREDLERLGVLFCDMDTGA